MFSPQLVYLKKVNFEMKKRTAFIGALVSLIPFGQTINLATASLLTGVAAIYSLSANAESKDAYYFYERGLNKLDNGNYKGAISDFTKAIKINPYKDPYAFHDRGLAKLNLKDYEGAISDFTEAIKINPKFGNAYYNGGLAKLNLKDYEGAISDFTEAIKINPQDGDAYYERGEAKLNLNNIKGAGIDQDKALEIFSKSKVQLTVKDIIASTMKTSKNPMWKGFNKFAGFDGKTYTKPITYYIHDETGRLNSTLLPKKEYKKTYEISDDEEKFIVDLFSRIDKYIDLDFKRVNSKKEAMIRIYKSDVVKNGDGIMSDTGNDLAPKFYRIDVAWGETKFTIPKLKNYPTLSTNDAWLISHEIGHALGLEHFDPGCGKICKSNFDPFKDEINSKQTVMSYNNVLNVVSDMFFTELDIKALQKVWGVEKGN